MTDPHNSYDSEEQPYREMFPKLYSKKSEDFWSDRATRIVFRVVALVFLVFSILFAFKVI